VSEKPDDLSGKQRCHHGMVGGLTLPTTKNFFDFALRLNARLHQSDGSEKVDVAAHTPV